MQIMNDNSTILTERGQVSVPASIRKEIGLKPGQVLRWERLSDTELRVIITSPPSAQGAFAALGYARRWLKPGTMPHTDNVMCDLRDGEED
jgi:AbrB family looped-hinge helix DNA binding protein